MRWQQWSHSPGLIYLRDGIMNSLWHLIWPSLLFWVSARIRGLIQAASASRLMCPVPSYASKWRVQCILLRPKASVTPRPCHAIEFCTFCLEICNHASLVWVIVLQWLSSFFLIFISASTTVQDPLRKAICGRQKHNLHFIESREKELQGLTLGQLQRWLN